MNSFLNLLDRANQNRWCTSPNCTTCGASEYRSAIRRLCDPGITTLANDLASLSLLEFEKRDNWGNALRIALDEITTAPQIDQVMQSWLPHLNQHVRLADLVLFYYVRKGALFGPMSVDQHSQWLDKCIELAIQSHDESLVESLVYTLGKRYQEHANLNALIEEMAQASPCVSKAVQRQCST